MSKNERSVEKIQMQVSVDLNGDQVTPQLAPCTILYHKISALPRLRRLYYSDGNSNSISQNQGLLQVYKMRSALQNLVPNYTHLLAPTKFLKVSLEGI